MKLRIDEDQLASCVGCGLCLPHCPTFRVTGEERYSPRGRIEAMRQVHLGDRPADASFLDMMDTCVQCRGCETACPSAVPFGRLMEGTRETLAETSGTQPRWRQLGYRALGFPFLLRVGSLALALVQRTGLLPSARLGLPPALPLKRPPLVPTAVRGEREPVWLFTGCVMDAWQRDVHLATQRVVEAAGGAVSFPGGAAGCCGALAGHAGLGDQARDLARRTMTAFPGDAPILVDAAGCGAQLKDYGHLLSGAEAAAFAARVLDVHEWLAARIDRLPEPAAGAERPLIAVQDPCHLRHVQRQHLPVRTVLGRYAELRELDDDGLCCGAGGAYAVFHRDLAGDIRARKVEAIRAAGAPVVASANPGCSLHLAAAGLDVRHPMELVAEALGLPRG